MTDTATTDTGATEPVPTQAHQHEHFAKVADLLTRLRLDVSDHHLATVLDWMDHFDESPADEAAEPTTEADDAPAGGEVAAEGTAVPPLASGDAAGAPAATSTEGTE